MKFFIYQNKKIWKHYLIPKFMNTITWSETGTKIYRWLIWGVAI